MSEETSKLSLATACQGCGHPLNWHLTSNNPARRCAVETCGCPGFATPSSGVTEGKAESGERIRVTNGVVAIYRPDRGALPVRHPWHCFNTYDGSFIECRTDEVVAGYCELPQYVAPSNGGKTSSGQLSDDRVKAGYAAAHEALTGRPPAQADEGQAESGELDHQGLIAAAAVIKRGFWFHKPYVEQARDAVTAYFAAAQPPAPADDTAEVLAGLREEMVNRAQRGDCTNSESEIWDEALALVEAAQRRLADRGQSGMPDEFEPYLAEAMKRPGFRAAYEAALREEENADE